MKMVPKLRTLLCPLDATLGWAHRPLGTTAHRVHGTQVSNQIYWSCRAGNASEADVASEDPHRYRMSIRNQGGLLSVKEPRRPSLLLKNKRSIES